jgi:transcription termination/antitermination protein NusG
MSNLVDDPILDEEKNQIPENDSEETPSPEDQVTDEISAPVEIDSDETAETQTPAKVENDDESPVESAPVGPQRAWFAVHCYSGYENKVKKGLDQRIRSMGMQDNIFRVIVPTEDEIDVREGQRKVIQRRVFPGYILVEMVMTEESWYVVRNTPGVTGFVSSGEKRHPCARKKSAEY